MSSRQVCFRIFRVQTERYFVNPKTKGQVYVVSSSDFHSRVKNKQTKKENALKGNKITWIYGRLKVKIDYSKSVDKIQRKSILIRVSRRFELT